MLLASKISRLVRDYRRQEPGSRLKGRTVAIFSALAVAPILVVYYFSLQFLNHGIDSWFELEVSQGLKDTRELSRAALEVRKQEFSQRTEAIARELSSLPNFDLIGTLDRERRESGALSSPCGRPEPDPRDQLRAAAGCVARAGHRRDGAADPARPAVSQPGHRRRGGLSDPRRRAPFGAGGSGRKERTVSVWTRNCIPPAAAHSQCVDT